MLLVMGWFIYLAGLFGKEIRTDNYSDKIWAIPMTIIGAGIIVVFEPFYFQNPFYWRLGIGVFSIFSLFYLASRNKN